MSHIVSAITHGYVLRAAHQGFIWIRRPGNLLLTKSLNALARTGSTRFPELFRSLNAWNQGKSETSQS